MATTVLTFEDLARRLGVRVETARRMTTRHRWRKTKDNHGRALVHVPDEYLARRLTEQETAPGTSPGTGPETSPKTAPGTEPRTAPEAAHLAALMARLEALERELMDAVHKLGAAEERAEGLRAVLDVEQRRCEEIAARAERVEREYDRALEQLEQAQAAHVDDLLALREQMAAIAHDRDRAAEALAAHLALPWWRRLFA